MSTIADLIRNTGPDACSKAIACFSSRDLDRENHTVTFHFADKSTLTFKVSYTLVPAQETA